MLEHIAKTNSIGNPQFHCSSVKLTGRNSADCKPPPSPCECRANPRRGSRVSPTCSLPKSHQITAFSPHFPFPLLVWASRKPPNNYWGVRTLSSRSGFCFCWICLFFPSPSINKQRLGRTYVKYSSQNCKGSLWRIVEIFFIKPHFKTPFIHKEGLEVFIIQITFTNNYTMWL